jgi:hypothetical protein
MLSGEESTGRSRTLVLNLWPDLRSLESAANPLWDVAIVTQAHRQSKNREGLEPDGSGFDSGQIEFAAVDFRREAARLLCPIFPPADWCTSGLPFCAAAYIGHGYQGVQQVA